MHPLRRFGLILSLFLVMACHEQEPAATAPPAADAGVAQSATPDQGRGKGKGGKGRKKGAGRGEAQAAELAEPTKAANISFIINTHDWYYHDKSAETLLRLVDLFTKYGIKGEFYFTDSVFRAHEARHPEVIQRLLATGMIISYHLRAPHPVGHRTARTKTLLALGRDELLNTLKQYETYALNLETGDYDVNTSGGYSHIKDRIGYAPPVLGMNPVDDRLRDLELTVLKNMGLRMWVRKHSGDVLEMTDRGVLSRPSEFHIEKTNGKFWWELNQPLDPAVLLDGASGYGTVLIHENNFYSDTPGWRQVYYRNLDTDAKPKQAPWNLTATEPGISFYTPEQVALIWANYEGFVSWASVHMRCVTSVDIIADWEEAQRKK